MKSQLSRVGSGVVGRVALAWMFGLGAVGGAAGCGVFDGGIEPVTKLPPPPTRPDTGSPDVTPETTEEVTAETEVTPTGPTLAMTVGAGGAAAVDGDWVEVHFDVTGFTLGTNGDGAIVLTTTGADQVATTTEVTSTTTVVRRVPVGAVLFHAELVDGGGHALSPAVTADATVTVTRAMPSVVIAAPLDGALLPGDWGPITVRLTTTDFTLLTAGVEPTGPRQGRVRVSVDGNQVGTWSALEGVITVATPTSVGAGSHLLKATLVDEADAEWLGTTAAVVTFTVDLAPTITIVAPTADHVVEGSRFTVKIATERFATDGQSTPGHGSWRATLDGTPHPKLVGDLATFAGLTAGAHHLEVELRGADDSALLVPVVAEVDFKSVIPAPTIDFVLPAIANVKEGAIQVAVIPHNFTFAPGGLGGALKPATGGWRLYVDEAIVADGLTATETTIVLTAGEHALRAELIDMQSAPLNPGVSATRNLTCMPIETSVEILAPKDGATVPKRFSVAVAFGDFTLSSNVLSPEQPPVPGRGHFHAFLRKDGDPSFVYQGFFLSETFQLEVPEPGGYDLKVALHYENHLQVLPAVEAVVHITVDDTPGVRILQPRAGELLRAEAFAVTVALDNFELIPLGEISNVRGHYHLFVDNDYQGFFLDFAAILDPRLTVPAAMTPGVHAIKAYLHRSDHTPVPGARSDSVAVTYQPVPAVTITGPSDDARVSTAPFPVEVEVAGLAIVNHAGAANVAGEGHLHVFVDNVYQGIQTTPRFTVQIPDAGPHIVKVSLHQNDHSPVPEAASASVRVGVDATPRVAIVAPEDGGFIYGPTADAWLEGVNLPAGAQVELWADDIVVYEGPVGLVALPPLAEGRHVLTAVAITASGEPMVGGALSEAAFEVVGLEGPTLTFVAPLAGASVAAGTTVQVGVTGFTLDARKAWTPAVPGDGLWTLTAGGVTYGPFAGTTATLPALPAGSTTLVVELRHRDGSLVWPPARAQVAVTVGGADKRMTLTSPGDGTTWYGGDVKVQVATSGFALAKGAGGWLAVNVDGARAAFFADDHGFVGPFAPGVHIVEVEAVNAAGASYVPAVKAAGNFRFGGVDRPDLVLLAPADGSTAVGDAVTVEFDTSAVTLDPTLIGGAPRPGYGAVLVLVDGRVRAVATESPFVLGGLSAGFHDVAVVLAGTDLVPVAPGFRAAARVKVLGADGP